MRTLSLAPTPAERDAALPDFEFLSPKELKASQNALYTWGKVVVGARCPQYNQKYVSLLSPTRFMSGILLG